MSDGSEKGSGASSQFLLDDTALQLGHDAKNTTNIFAYADVSQYFPGVVNLKDHAIGPLSHVSYAQSVTGLMKGDIDHGLCLNATTFAAVANPALSTSALDSVRAMDASYINTVKAAGFLGIDASDYLMQKNSVAGCTRADGMMSSIACASVSQYFPDVVNIKNYAIGPLFQGSDAPSVTDFMKVGIDHGLALNATTFAAVTNPALLSSASDSVRAPDGTYTNAAMAAGFLGSDHAYYLRQENLIAQRGIHTATDLYNSEKSRSILDSAAFNVRVSAVDLVRGAPSDLASIARWSSAMSGVEAGYLDRIHSKDLSKTFGALHKTALDFASFLGPSLAGIRESLGFDPLATDSRLPGAQIKMSALAAASAFALPDSSFSTDIYRSLMGEWRTSLDLPEAYWHDPRVRKRMYRHAGVDHELIDAPPGAALEAMVDSGLVAGVRRGKSVIAMLQVGEFSVTVHSDNTVADAPKIVTSFENELRGYITRKLSEKYGDDWFKERASHIIGKAKDVRKAALQSGENHAPLIHFIDIGDLASIILRNDNWTDVFESTFVRKDAFKYEMDKLVAVRRPMMHSRPVDGVRIVEIMTVIGRLTRQMAIDGSWIQGAESDQ